MQAAIRHQRTNCFLRNYRRHCSGHTITHTDIWYPTPPPQKKKEKRKRKLINPKSKEEAVSEASCTLQYWDVQVKCQLISLRNAPRFVIYSPAMPLL